jgi:hypothetical protein
VTGACQRTSAADALCNTWTGDYTSHRVLISCDLQHQKAQVSTRDFVLDDWRGVRRSTSTPTGLG